MSCSDQLREISRTFLIHKRLERFEIIAALNALIELAERLEKLEDRVPKPDIE